MTSQDGKQWSTQDEGITDYLQQFIYDPLKQRFYLTYEQVDFGDAGILASDDGANWKKVFTSDYNFHIVVKLESEQMWAATDGDRICICLPFSMR